MKTLISHGMDEVQSKIPSVYTESADYKQKRRHLNKVIKSAKNDNNTKSLNAAKQKLTALDADFKKLKKQKSQERKAYFKKVSVLKKKMKKDFKVKKNSLLTTKKEIKSFTIRKIVNYNEKVEFINNGLSSISYNAKTKAEISALKKNTFKNSYKDFFVIKKELKNASTEAKKAFSNKAQYKKAVADLKNNVKKLKVEHKANVKSLKVEFENKRISKLAYKQESERSKILMKANIRDAKLSFDFKKIKEEKRYHAYRFATFYWKQKAILRQEAIGVYDKNYSDVRFVKTRLVLAPIMNFILPGVGALINGQYHKAFWQLFWTAILLPLTIMAVTGVIYVHGRGLIGLFTLGEGDVVRGDAYWVDSRFYMVEGILAAIMLTIYIVYASMMARNAKLTAKTIAEGKVPGGWYRTKRFLINDSLPYKISGFVYVFILIATVMPLVTSVLIMFTNWGEKGHVAPQNLIGWVGFDNIKDVFSFGGQEGQRFTKVLGWTVIWGISSTAISLFMGIFIGIMVNNEKIKGKKIYRLIYILPQAIPGFIMILFFSLMLSPKGIVNRHIVPIFEPWQPVKHLDGVTFVQRNWLNDVNKLKMMLFFINTWMGFSGMVVMVSGLLQSISKDLYEAASIDGATSWGKFRRITGPTLLYQIAPMLIGAFIGGLNNFGIIYLLNNGGPPDYNDPSGPGETDIVLSYVFRMVRDLNRPAMGSAYITLVSAGLAIIGYMGFKRSKTFKEGNY